VVRLAFTLFVVCLLLLVGLRNANLLRLELQRVELANRERSISAFPKRSDMSGIGGGGILMMPKVDPRSPSKLQGSLLVFTLHERRLGEDARYWGQVDSQIRRHLITEIRPIELWGVCDEGAVCERTVHVPFVIVGYLKSYEMHSVAVADSAGKALLYDRDHNLRKQIEIKPDASAEADLIAQELR